MKTENLFNVEYVKSLLLPFEDKVFRLRTENENKSFKLPFVLETSIESTFSIELNNRGIRLILKDNFYIKKNLREVFSGALKEVKIYPSTLDKLLKEESKEDCVIFSKIVKHLEDNFNPQIGFIYYNMIESLKVDVNGFTLNGFSFKIY